MVNVVLNLNISMNEEKKKNIENNAVPQTFHKTSFPIGLDWFVNNKGYIPLGNTSMVKLRSMHNECPSDLSLHYEILNFTT